VNDIDSAVLDRLVRGGVNPGDSVFLCESRSQSGVLIGYSDYHYTRQSHKLLDMHSSDEAGTDHHGIASIHVSKPPLLAQQEFH
jgi:hypothetical protein